MDTKIPNNSWRYAVPKQMECNSSLLSLGQIWWLLPTKFVQHGKKQFGLTMVKSDKHCSSQIFKMTSTVTSHFGDIYTFLKTWWEWHFISGSSSQTQPSSHHAKTNHRTKFQYKRILKFTRPRLFEIVKLIQNKKKSEKLLKPRRA